MSYMCGKRVFTVYKNDELSKAELARFCVVSKWNIAFSSLLNTAQGLTV